MRVIPAVCGREYSRVPPDLLSGGKPGVIRRRWRALGCFMSRDYFEMAFISAAIFIVAKLENVSETAYGRMI